MGRPLLTANYVDLYFLPVKNNGGAKCIACGAIIKNSAKSRLESHRRICRPYYQTTTPIKVENNALSICTKKQGKIKLGGKPALPHLKKMSIDSYDQRLPRSFLNSREEPDLIRSLSSKNRATVIDVTTQTLPQHRDIATQTDPFVGVIYDCPLMERPKELCTATNCKLADSIHRIGQLLECAIECLQASPTHWNTNERMEYREQDRDLKVSETMVVGGLHSENKAILNLIQQITDLVSTAGRLVK